MTRRTLLGITLALVVILILTGTQQPVPVGASDRQTQTAEARTTASGPDICEPNETLSQPCALAADTTTSGMNFYDRTVDVYSFDLTQGKNYTIQVRGASGITPYIEVFDPADVNTPVAQSDSESHSLIATVQISVPPSDDDTITYLVRVQNTQNRASTGTYQISALQDANISGPVVPTSTVVGLVSGSPDLYENNYNVATARQLVWGVPYDLSLACPVPLGCSAGDHDFFLFPVKAGVRMSIIAYDLGPGTDPVLTLYSPDPTQTDNHEGTAGWRYLMRDDDRRPELSLTSYLEYTPNWNGYAVLVVSSASHQDPPSVPSAAGIPGRYRLILGSSEQAAVKAVILAQQQLLFTPTSTPRPAVAGTGPGTAPGPRPSAPAGPAGASPTGAAVIIRQGATLYATAPPAEGDELATYPAGTQVQLLGQQVGAWVRVQPANAVVSGWMHGSDLRLLTGPQPQPDAPTVQVPNVNTTPGPRTTVVPTTNGSAPKPTDVGAPSGPRPVRVAPVPVQPVRPAPTQQSRLTPRNVQVEVCQAAPGSTELTPGGATTCTKPLPQIIVEVVVDSTQMVLQSRSTDAQGRVTLPFNVSGDAKIVLRIPVFGLEQPLNTQDQQVAIRIP